jgi:hypothetical protein
VPRLHMSADCAPVNDHENLCLVTAPGPPRSPEGSRQRPSGADFPFSLAPSAALSAPMA